MLSVIVISQDGTRRQEAFAKGSITLGRVADGTDLVLAGNGVSARHAVLASREGAWLIADLGSTNGTWVNGQRIQSPSRIGRDDVVQIGEFTLQVTGDPIGAGAATGDAGTSSTVAIEMPPPVPRRDALGITWNTVKHDNSRDAASAQQPSDPGSWSTMQAPVVNEETHGPESVRIISTPSARTSATCMSCGASLAPDAVFCQACGARRASAPATVAGALQADSLEYDATGAVPIPPSPAAYDATALVAAAASSFEYEATGAMPVAPDAIAQAPAAPTPAPEAAATPAVTPVGMQATRVLQAADVPAVPAGEAHLPMGAAPFIVVDPSGATGVRSVAEAIRLAPVGSVVRVKPGRYVGQLVLDKPLSLIADGGPVVVESSEGPCLLSYAATGMVQGFSFRSAPGNAPDPAVAITRGSLRLDRCEVLSSRGAGLVIEGPESDPIVSSCAIRGAGAEGVVVQMGARPRLDGCTMTGSARAGICVHDGGVPTVTRCTVHDTQAQGVLVHGESAGTFEDCEIAACRLAGVDVLAGGRPTMRRCRIRDSREGCGVIAQYGGSGVFEECLISGHRLSAVEVREGGQPWFRRCSLVESQIERGLYVYDRGAGVFEDCEIGRSARHGVGVRTGGQPVLRRCRVHGSAEAGGIYLYRQGAGTFDECQIDGNQLIGVEVVEGSLASLRRCRIFGNTHGALRVSGNRALHAVECEFRGGASRALHMDAAAHARLERCLFVGECACSVDCTCDTEGSTFQQA